MIEDDSGTLLKNKIKAKDAKASKINVQLKPW